MNTPPLTQLLAAARGGDHAAAESLFELLYGELHGVARRIFSSQPSNHTLQPTALVNEVYLKLFSSGTPQWEDRAHLLNLGARVMRQVLVNHARDRKAAKRGGDLERERVTLSADLGVHSEDSALGVLALDDELEALAHLDPRQARIVELRVFGGLTIEETAKLVEVSTRTVELDWKMARAWLAPRLESRTPLDSD